MDEVSTTPGNDNKTTPAVTTEPNEPVQVGDSVVGSVQRPNKSNIIVPVTIAVLVAAALVTVGFLTYNAKESPKPAPQEETADTLDHTSPVDEATIDQETSEVDKTQQDLDNDTDFNDSEISDENLGL